MSPVSMTRTAPHITMIDEVSSPPVTEKNEHELSKSTEATEKGAETPKDPGNDEPEFPTGLKLVTITIALCFTVFCVALDNTIIATAIPRITDNFRDLGDVGWYASAYLLTNCTFQLLFGKFYSLFSIKWTFLTALAIFEIGSLICGVAPNSVALILGRAIAGLGAGGLFSGSLIIVAYTVPLAKRPIYIGFISSMFGIASVVGPLMGGAFTDHVTWRLCFYINLPLGVVTAIGLLLFFKSPPRQAVPKEGFRARLNQFDPIGTICFVPAVISLLLALQWGGTKYPWSNGRIIALFVLFGVLAVAFVADQIWKGEDATVPPRIIQHRSVKFGLLWALLIGSVFFTFVYYLPIWFQAVKGVSATQSGINTLPLLLSQVVATISAGILVSKFGYYVPLMYCSAILISTGSGLMTTFAVDSPSRIWIGYQVIFGIGIGFGFQQALVAAQTVLPKEDIPAGSALVMFFQLLGGSVFVSVAQNTFANNLITNVVREVPDLDPQAIVKAGATQIKYLVDPSRLTLVLQAYNGALTRTFRVGMIMACLTSLAAAGMEWRSLKQKKVDVVAA